MNFVHFMEMHAVYRMFRYSNFLIVIAIFFIFLYTIVVIFYAMTNINIIDI